MSVGFVVRGSLFRFVLVTCVGALAVACSSSAEPPDDEGEVEASSTALTFAPGPTDPGGGGLIGATCASVCTATSRCDTNCDGAGSCGAYGVCQSCASVCSETSSCEQGCLNGSTYTTCRGAGLRCRGCSATTCEASGCAAHCWNGERCDWWTGQCGNTYRRCDAYGASIGDRDTDGLPDALETALARKFFPQMVMTTNDWRHFYGNVAGDPSVGGLYCNGNQECQLPFVVRRVAALGGSKTGWCATNQCAEIIYGLPYNWDLGDTETRFPKHRGDSENVSVLVAHRRADDEADGADWGVDFATAKSDANAWRIVGIFYAAHKCDNSLTVDWDSSRFLWPRDGATYSTTSHPMLFAAERKHASYPNAATCDGGGKWFDYCGNNDVWVDRNVVTNRLVNVGEEYGGSLSGAGYVCAGFDTTIAMPSSALDSPVSGTYDVWRGGSFGSDKAKPFYNQFKRRVLDWGNDAYTCW
jgi:hypothetical protein